MSAAWGEVTPAGWRAGPTRRKRGWGRVLFGLLMMFAGIAAIPFGIINVIGERDRIEDDAVARGVSDGQSAALFTAEPRDYTVFLIFGGGFASNTATQESAVANTACEVDLGTGRRSFTGSRQGVSYTLGSASSVGKFDAPGGEASIVCLTSRGPVAYVVTPGSPSLLRSILMIIAGAFVFLGGVGLLIWGLIGKKVPASGLS